MLISSLLVALATVATPIAIASPIDDTIKELSQPVGIACGRATCIGEQVCCNPTCSTCTAPGMMCTMQDCGHLSDPPAFPKPPTVAAPGPRLSISKVMTRPNSTKPAPYAAPKPKDGVACGKNTCAADEVCCNASCGICTPPKGGCIMMFCRDGQRPGQSVHS
ncbi:uncharacterized protein PpBr36_06448 [Pyricularia pennisetigena]|uniref:uncharacterized protein n=1 Tax=Pyricularia pennisetigena TaxID=1578925 RepID=UPI0011515094|nr:uncharacterized protein PpBr36_06448 [Pyricularia pennisetigena]TLS22816.1 hypothetical protein PpBr36_06448 [Pyricularia pennisetigena]